MKDSEAARLLNERVDELAQITEEPGRLTRTCLSSAMEQANALVGGWMREIGMETREDSVGNIIGRLPSRIPNPRPKTLLLGSHLDTVRNAGRFDGALGVLLPIVALKVLRERGLTLPFDVEVLGFSEEEGVRFESAYLGSAGYCGRLKESMLELRDADGMTLREVLERRNGGRFFPPAPAHHRRELTGYVEVHIEQGPVLESEKIAVGVVSGIVGQTRFKVAWKGRAGHAGTTPMRLRRDALAGAAEFTIAVEKLAKATRGLVATIGTLEIPGGAPNVIPGEVRHTLEVRHADDSGRRDAIRTLNEIAASIAGRRSLSCVVKRTQDDPAVGCSPVLTARLAASVKRVQGSCLELQSGAGHDAVVVSRLCPVAMLLVRCKNGLSHHPDEFTSARDLGVALRVVIDFLTGLA